MTWFVYIVECADTSLYCGCTPRVDQRLALHNSGKGAKYTRSRLPVILRYSEACADRSSALKREWAIKQLTREQKEQLIALHRVS